MTDEELIAAGKLLCRAYYIGINDSKEYADSEANRVINTYNGWAKQAKTLAEMGHTIVGGATTIAGRAIAGEALLSACETLAENVKITLEAEEKKPEQNRKLIAQWRFALNCLLGAAHKRGLIPDLKDAGPGAY